MRNYGIKGNVSLKSTNSIDSSFVFSTDTISLPFFDDFSTNKFQSYSADFTTPGVSSQLYYQIIDPITLAPFPSGTVFSNQPTFKRTVDLINNTFSDTTFNPISIKLGDFLSYPIQYQTVDVYPPYYIYDTVGIADISDTIWLENPTYLQDSARIFFASINDPSKLWIDSFAYHNYRFGLNPRSLGVVTFDGLDENGYPYLINSAQTNYADRLTSKPIDMSALDASDSAYFSFLYQPEGLGDIPEQGDSLVLEFYAKDLDQWFRVWSINGDNVHPFRAAHVNISDTKYFKKGFQFRFRNYGSLAGGLDHFHIDYVHLRTLSAFNDTLFKDFAFVYPLNSLLDTYTSVPWDHYKESTTNKMSDSVLIKLHNGSPNSENYQNGQINVSHNGSFEGNFILQGFNLAESNINYSPRTTHTSFYDCSNGYEYDRSKTGDQQTFEVKANASAQFPNFNVNDSTIFYQEFFNFYSYDDGSAEAAFGPTGTQARLAIEFNAYQPDSLIGINMHFVPSVTNVSNKLFLITVWDDNNGVPGTILYEDDPFFPNSPIYGDETNQFHTYYFSGNIKVPVGEKFHVGWRQLDPERLNLGLDRNIDRSETIRFSVDGGFNWLTSPFPGSAMIRPVFSTALDPILSANSIETDKKVILFPNPTSQILNIGGIVDLEGVEIELYDAFGRFILKSTNTQIDLSEYQSGIYFVRIPSISDKTYKVIKQ
ncbi:MAG: T9SS type A sorting domain-containing protein [Bacteroidetes bacterium]|nr:T9SS type A sorting domain-containing protein [Bacteroidota bacterium]